MLILDEVHDVTYDVTFALFSFKSTYGARRTMNP